MGRSFIVKTALKLLLSIGTHADRQPVHILKCIFIIFRGGDKTDIKASNNGTQCPPNKRRCVIDGKEFTVVRHFEGRSLSTIMTEIAIERAKRDETKLK